MAIYIQERGYRNHSGGHRFAYCLESLADASSLNPSILRSVRRFSISTEKALAGLGG